MDFKIDDICLVSDSSLASYNFWKKLSGHISGLLCPCSIKCYTRLKVIEKLTKEHYLLQLLDEPTRLTVFYKGDLKIAPLN